MVKTSAPSWQDRIDNITGIVADFLDKNPEFVAHAVNKDAALKGKSLTEVKSELSSYPGVIAVSVNKVAHELYKKGKGLEARQISEDAHTLSGIDIHPGTQIGANCFIDHGTGVVIGETAKIGKGTLIYHGVTLGAYGDPGESNPEKLAHRHPEIGDNCLVSVGAKILGNVKIGNNVAIGPDAKIYGKGITIGNNVRIGTDVKIAGGNQLADGVEISDGISIPRNTGKITQDIVNSLTQTINISHIPTSLLAKTNTVDKKTPSSITL